MNDAAPTPSQIARSIPGYDPKSLSVGQARAFIRELAQPVSATERLPIRSALGRVLAQDMVSTIDVPSCDNSAMDGYAFSSAAIVVDEPILLELAIGKSLAGKAFERGVAPGECVRIMTGAVMPVGCDTVVPQELVTLVAGCVAIGANVVRGGDNRRRAGEDLARGEVALAAGRLLRPADIGVLASLGQSEVVVRRRVRVAFFSTGNELRSVGEPLDEGCVYDSNRYTLWGMLARLGVEIIDMGVVKDDPHALRNAFSQAAESADVVITSGGVSVGDADYTRQVMAELGDVLFWQIDIRPGRPMAIGRIGPPLADSTSTGGSSSRPQALLFGLPGNPVAVMVTFYAFVRDALLAMAGATPAELPLLRAVASHAMRKKPGRTEYQRGIVTRAADGRWQVAVAGAQGSGMLRSMSEANGLILLGHDQGPVASGDWVDVIPFDGIA
ncbi:MAG: molybdopterin molybdenumtransferase MoeA [Rhizobacter sp.]|nr:molybdopterin molybdenumtransferase MoeA [Rhizobacter sp.]